MGNHQIRLHPWLCFGEHAAANLARTGRGLIAAVSTVLLEILALMPLSTGPAGGRAICRLGGIASELSKIYSSIMTLDQIQSYSILYVHFIRHEARHHAVLNPFSAHALSLCAALRVMCPAALCRLSF